MTYEKGDLLQYKDRLLLVTERSTLDNADNYNETSCLVLKRGSNADYLEGEILLFNTTWLNMHYHRLPQ
jgi:hypothetical protein